MRNSLFLSTYQETEQLRVIINHLLPYLNSLLELINQTNATWPDSLLDDAKRLLKKIIQEDFDKKSHGELIKTTIDITASFNLIQIFLQEDNSRFQSNPKLIQKLQSCLEQIAKNAR